MERPLRYADEKAIELFPQEEHTLMTTNLRVNGRFPDFVLPNHQNESMRLSQLTRPNLFDQRLGFLDGYPHS